MHLSVGVGGFVNGKIGMGSCRPTQGSCDTGFIYFPYRIFRIAVVNFFYHVSFYVLYSISNSDFFKSSINPVHEFLSAFIISVNYT